MANVHDELGLALERKRRLEAQIDASRERVERLDEELTEAAGLLEHARRRPHARLRSLLTFTVPMSVISGYAGFLFTNSDAVGFVFATCFVIASVARGREELTRERAFVRRRRQLTLRVEELEPQEHEIEVPAAGGGHVSR